MQQIWATAKMIRISLEIRRIRSKRRALGSKLMDKGIRPRWGSNGVFQTKAWDRRRMQDTSLTHHILKILHYYYRVRPFLWEYWCKMHVQFGNAQLNHRSRQELVKRTQKANENSEDLYTIFLLPSCHPTYYIKLERVDQKLLSMQISVRTVRSTREHMIPFEMNSKKRARQWLEQPAVFGRFENLEALENASSPIWSSACNLRGAMQPSDFHGGMTNRLLQNNAKGRQRNMWLTWKP